VAGRTGEGKTTFITQAGAAFVKRDAFLEPGWIGKGGRLLVVDLEQGERSVRRQLCQAGLSERDDVDLLLIPEGIDLNDQRQVEELEQMLEKGRYDLVSFEPYYKAYRGDSNDDQAILDIMRGSTGCDRDSVSGPSWVHTSERHFRAQQLAISPSTTFSDREFLCEARRW
jgi:hypothetical protein